MHLLTKIESVRELGKQMQSVFSKFNQPENSTITIFSEFLANISTTITPIFQLDLKKMGEFSSVTLGFVTPTALKHKMTSGYIDASTLGLNFSGLAPKTHQVG